MKAIVIGGSNGLGLAISKELINRGYLVDIFDIQEVESDFLPVNSYNYHRFNLLGFDDDIFKDYISNPDVSVLMITAGIGRITTFDNISSIEIDKTMNINTVSIMKIIRVFYSKISGDEAFYCGVMGSIAGLVSSPLFSVYAASKAALIRFVESINIELEKNGTENRILCVSPASFKGSRFNGGENHIEQMGTLPSLIIDHMINGDTTFLPDYNELLKGIIDRYNVDPHAFGIQSYQYKLNSGRVSTSKGVIIGYLSGTFDLFHIGHLNLLRRAKDYCDYLIVGVHDSGKWKGKETFIPLDERKEIVGACKYVDKVVDSCREDSDAWSLWHYDRLFVGSDYKGTERFNRYEEYFKDKGVEIVYFPYTQGTSSTQLRVAINDK